MKYILLASLLLLASFIDFSQEGKSKLTPVNASLDELAWISGSWSGEGLGGEVEEHWNQPNGDSMLGMFRLTTEKETKVSEFLMISKEKDRVVYRFKHFNLDFSTWEKNGPLEFTLVELSDTEAIFQSELKEQNSPRRLTYRMSEEAGLSVLVQGSDNSGSLNEGFLVEMRRD